MGDSRFPERATAGRAKTALWTDPPGEPATLALGYGDSVWVRAYGKWRPGVVNRVARTRVSVTFTRNAAGGEDTRVFSLSYVRIRDSKNL